MTVKLIILAVYFLILFLIGYFSSRRISDIADYYVGGKKLGYWVVAFSTRATGESAWLLLGLTGLGAVAGISAYWVVLGEVLGVSIAWFVLAKPFKRLSDEYDSITIPDYLESRFRTGSHLLRIIASIALSAFVVIYVSAQIDATGSAFEVFLGFDYFTGAVTGFAIVVVYIFFGGFVAVAWSDLFQGLLMFLGLVLLPPALLFFLGDGPVLEKIGRIDPGLLNIWGPGGPTALNLATVLGYAFIGLGFMGSPQIFVRFIAIRGEEEIDKGRWVAVVYTLLTDAAAVTIGIMGRYFFTEAGMDPEAALGNNGQDVLILTVERFMPLAVVGIYVAVVLAAIMSTIDSLLVVASSAVVRDLYQQVFHPESKNRDLTGLSRMVTLFLAALALALAIVVATASPERTIFWIVIFGWSGIAATFCPVILLSLFWRGYTERGAISSMITGFLSVPLFKFAAPLIPGWGVYFDKVAELGPSFALSMLAGYLVSRWKPDADFMVR